MSTLVEKIQSFVSKFPIVQNGNKLTQVQAENAIWSFLSDTRIGIQKDDSQTHSLLDPSLISERDIRTVFCDENNVALPCVRAFMKEVLSSPAEVPAQEPSMIGKVLEEITANKPIGQYSTKELLERYDADAPNEIWAELERRAKNQPCIVFDGGMVNVKVSLGILQDIRKNIGSIGPVYYDGKKAYRVYPIGTFPEESAICCPITGKILNNGYCSDLGINWSGISEDCLVFIRVIRDQNSGELFSKFAAKALLKIASEGMEALRADYTEEALVYDELKSLNQLPSLKVSLNSMAAGRKVGRASDPFGSPKRF